MSGTKGACAPQDPLGCHTHVHIIAGEGRLAVELEQGSRAVGHSYHFAVADLCLPMLGTAVHHRSKRGPRYAPAKVHKATVPPYQSATKGIESSVQ